MDEAAVDDLIYGKLDYSTSLIDRALNITVWDMTPEAYMEKLGFTDEEKEWASLLYSVLADDQSVSYDDTDGDGYYNTDYGDVTFEHQDTPGGVLQSDGRPLGQQALWEDRDDWRGGLWADRAGHCGGHAGGFIRYALRCGEMVGGDRPPLRGERKLSQSDPGWRRTLWAHSNRDWKQQHQLVEALQDGKLVIALMSKGHFTNGGHFIVLRGITEDGKILVADPASVKRSNQEWELGIVVNEARRGAAAGGPFWVFS